MTRQPITVHRCSGLRRHVAPLDRPLPDLRRVERRGRGGRGAARRAPASGTAAPGRQRPPCRPRPTSMASRPARRHRHRRARPGARRRAGARLGDPGRRRAGHRQVDAAAPGAGGHGRRRAPLPAGVRRGVAPAGQAAGAAPGPLAARPVAGRRRDHPAGSVRGGRDVGARRAGGRLHPDRLGPRRRVRRRLGDPGAGLCPRPDRSWPRARRLATVLVGHVTKEGPWPGPGCSSTWSTPCSPSRASATTPCACCGRSSTASAPPASSGCSR